MPISNIIAIPAFGNIIGIGRVTTARHRDGNTFPIELSVGEAWIDGARVFTGFIHDITERQEAQVRLQDLQSELAHVGAVERDGHARLVPGARAQPAADRDRQLLRGRGQPARRRAVRGRAGDGARRARRSGRPGGARGRDRAADARLHDPRPDRISGRKPVGAGRPKPTRWRWSARASRRSTSRSASIRCSTGCSSTGSRSSRCCSTSFATRSRR